MSSSVPKNSAKLARTAPIRRGTMVGKSVAPNSALSKPLDTRRLNWLRLSGQAGFGKSAVPGSHTLEANLADGKKYADRNRTHRHYSESSSLVESSSDQDSSLVEDTTQSSEVDNAPRRAPRLQRVEKRTAMELVVSQEAMALPADSRKGPSRLTAADMQKALSVLPADSNPGRIHAAGFIDTALGMVPDDAAQILAHPEFATAICRSAAAVKATGLEGDQQLFFGLIFEVDVGSQVSKARGDNLPVPHANAGKSKTVGSESATRKLPDSADALTNAEGFRDRVVARAGKKLTALDKGLLDTGTGKIAHMIKAFGMAEKWTESAAELAANLIGQVIDKGHGHPAVKKHRSSGTRIHADLLTGLCLAALDYVSLNQGQAAISKKQKNAIIDQAKQYGKAGTFRNGRPGTTLHFLHYYTGFLSVLQGKTPRVAGISNPVPPVTPRTVATTTPALAKMASPRAGAAGIARSGQAELKALEEKRSPDQSLANYMANQKNPAQIVSSFMRESNNQPTQWLKAFRQECKPYFGQGHDQFDRLIADSGALNKAVPPLGLNMADATPEQQAQIRAAQGAAAEIGNAISVALLDNPDKAYGTIPESAKVMLRDMIRQLEANAAFKALSREQQDKAKRDAITGAFITYGLNSALLEHAPARFSSATDKAAAARLSTSVGSHVKALFGFDGMAKGGAQDHILRALDSDEGKRLKQNAGMLIDRLYDYANANPGSANLRSGRSSINIDGAESSDELVS